MSDETARRLFDWGEEIGANAGAEVIAVDFRRSGSIQVALIGVKEAFPLGEFIPQLIAMELNVIPAPDIASAVEASGVPYTFVRPKSFDRPRTRTQDNIHLVRRRAMVATVIADDGKADDFIDDGPNHRVVKILSRITKRPVVYVDVPENIARHSMRELGMPASLVEALLGQGSAQGCSRATAQ